MPAEADRRVFALAPAVVVLSTFLVFARDPGRARPRRQGPRRRRLLRARGVEPLGDRRAHGRLGEREQVRAARRAARRRAAHRVRAAAAARGRRRRDPGRHDEPAGHRARRSRTARSSAATASATRSSSRSSSASRCSSSPRRPSSPRRRSTCRSPRASSSPATWSSTPASASSSSSSASSAPRSRSPRSPPRCSSAAGRFPACTATGPTSSGPFVLFAKLMFVAFLMFWVRFTYPRLREDQLQALAWKFLIPIGLLNILADRRLQGGVLMATQAEAPRPDRRSRHHVQDDAEARGHGAVPAREGRPAPRARVASSRSRRRTAPSACCARRSCPDWCIYIEGHKEKRPPRREGGRAAHASACSTASTSTTRSACTAGSASRCARSTRCSGAPSTSTPSRSIAELLHDKEKLGEWMETVPEPEPLEIGAETGRRSSAMWAQNVAFWILAVAMARRRDRRRALEERRARRALPRRRARRRGRAVHPARRRVRRLGAGAHLHRRGRHPVPLRHHAHARADAAARRQLDNDQRWPRPWSWRCSCFGVLAALLVDAFGGKEIKFDDELVAAGQHQQRRRRDLPRLPRARSRSCRCSCSPRSSAPSSWRGGTDAWRSTSSSILSAFLFCTGIYGVLARRNGVLVLMSIELMLNAVNINLIAFSAFSHDVVGPGVRAVRHHDRGRRGRRRPRDRAAHLPQPAQPRPRRGRPAEGLTPNRCSTHAWLIPAHPRGLVRRDPLLREAPAEQGRRDRHRRRRRVVRPLVRRGRRSGSTGSTTRTRATHGLGAFFGTGIARRRAASTARGRRSRSIHTVTWWQNGGVDVRRRHPDRRPRRDDAVRRHAHLAARAHLLDGVHARRPPLHVVLRRAVAVHRVDAAARRRRQHAAAARRAGSSSASARSC